MFEWVGANNERILEARESDDVKVRDQRAVSLSAKHRIRTMLRGTLSDAVRSLEEPVNVNTRPPTHACPRARGKRPLVWTPGRVERWAKEGTIPREVRVWTPEQTRTFLEHSRKYVWLHLLSRLIAVKGLRRGEAVGLLWAHTRLTDGEADIRAQVVRLSWTAFPTTPKSEAGQRTVTPDADTVKVVRVRRRVLRPGTCIGAEVRRCPR